MLINLEGHEKDSGIYRIVNLVNGRIYIGSSVRFINRVWMHRHQFRHNKHPNVFLQRDYDKCGPDSFKFEILEIVPIKENLITREQCYIDIYYDNGVNCYNMTPTAGSTLGRKFSEETKMKMSAIHAGKAGTMTGKHHTDETKRKISLASKGRQTRLGAVLSAETREKISASNKGKTRSEKTKEKYIKHYASRIISEETRAKWSSAARKNTKSKKTWTFVSPAGEIVSFVGLITFCRERPELKLQESLMRAVNSGKRKQHKGWTKYIEPVSTKEEIHEHSNQ